MCARIERRYGGRGVQGRRQRVDKEVELTRRNHRRPILIRPRTKLVACIFAALWYLVCYGDNLITAVVFFQMACMNAVAAAALTADGYADNTVFHSGAVLESMFPKVLVP